MDTKRIRRFVVVVIVVAVLVAGATQGSPALSQSIVADSVQNGRIAFVSERDGNVEIYVMNADGTGVTKLTNNQVEDWDPAWSSDGSKIAFERYDFHRDIYVMNTDGTGQTNLTNNQAFNRDPAWSSDGSKIIFLFTDAPNYGYGYDISVMNADGTGVTRLTNDGAGYSDPSWSPDGSKIIFSSLNGTTYCNSDIYVMNADGSGQTNLTNNDNTYLAYYGHPSWSPDGGKIAFVFGSPFGNSDIYVMNADGSGVIRLTNNDINQPVYNDYPSWSPDGSKITFNSNRDGNGEIYVMNADGSGQTRLTNNPAWDWMPAWGPGEVVSPTPTATSSPTPTLTPTPTTQPTQQPTPQPTSTPSGEGIHLDVPFLRQDERSWANDIYNLYGSDRIADTIARWGCATTSAAMVLSYYSGSEVSPKDLDDWLAANSGYTPEHGIIWTRIPWFAWERLGLTLAQPVYVGVTVSRLDNALVSGNPPIVNVRWEDSTGKERWHWVVVTGRNSDGTYAINDPSVWLNRQTLNEYLVWGNMITYASASGPTAPSLWLYLCSPAEMLVTDSLGRRTGVDPAGGQLSEIPGSFYGDEYLSPADTSDVASMHTKVLVLPEGGTYTVEVTGTGDGSYTLLVLGSDSSNGGSLRQSITRSVRVGQSDSFVLSYSPIDGSLDLVQRVHLYLPIVFRQR